MRGKSEERMSELDAALETIGPELLAMTRLFSLPDSWWDPPSRFLMRAEERSGFYHITFVCGNRASGRRVHVPSEADPDLQALHRRRAARRLCKQTLYDLCRQRPAPGDAFMDVYIGIPFCTTRCAYCSFASGEIGDGRLVAPYMEALSREIRACAPLIRRSGRSLRALYVGGGTPTALPLEHFQQLLDLIREFFPDAAEITVEAGRPDTLTREKLRAVREAGVSRISINPQTMNDRTLRIIGRAHTAQQVREAYALAREEGIAHINMDVIAGLPGEEEADFDRTMADALLLRPESLTVHTLALKRSSRMSLENAPLPDGQMAARMVARGLETARFLGMQPYYLYRQKYMAGNLENTGYALPGHACLYNVDMMEETSHILALGAGGISKRIWPQEGRITRAPNVSNIPDYIARVDEMIRRKEELFPEENAKQEELP